MPANSQHHPLRIALSFEAMHAPLAILLARQRAEEPDTPIVFSEVLAADLFTGMEVGLYDVGIALGARTTDRLKARPIWHDEMAVAVPARSPLLSFPVIPLSVLADYPVVMWHPDTCTTMHQYVKALFEREELALHVAAHARSFEFMATLVAAGYGVGLAARSWIDAARGAGIVARTFHAGDRTITASLLYDDHGVSERVVRFVERALCRSGQASWHA